MLLSGISGGSTVKLPTMTMRNFQSSVVFGFVELQIKSELLMFVWVWGDGKSRNPSNFLVEHQQRENNDSREAFYDFKDRNMRTRCLPRPQLQRPCYGHDCKKRNVSPEPYWEEIYYAWRCDGYWSQLTYQIALWNEKFRRCSRFSRLWTFWSRLQWLKLRWRLKWWRECLRKPFVVWKTRNMIP